MLRFTLFVLLVTALLGPVAGVAQESTSSSGAQIPNPAQPTPAFTEPQPLSAEVAAAEEALSKSDWKTAEAKLDSWLTSHPTDARALFDAGYAADAQNRLDDAAALYRRAITVDPKSFEAHISLGLLLARQGNPDDARPELATATTLDSGESGPALKARAWRALAGIDRTSDATAASNDLLEALKLSPETPADTLLAANLAEQTGQNDAAEAAYRRILAQDPKSQPAITGLAHLLIVKKRFAEAEALLRPAVEQSPDDPALTAQLATVLAAQDKAEALPMLQKLHAAHPDDLAITHMLAQVLADAGDYAGSDDLYIKLLAASPKSAGLFLSHGQNLVRRLRYVEAIAAFKRATELDPSSADAWSGLAFAASRAEQPNVTLHALTMRSNLQPENASTYFLWATAYDTLRQKDQAVAYYHHFLDASAGKRPNEEWQARQRLQLLEKK